MSELVLKLFRCKGSINSLAVSVEDGIRAEHAWLPRPGASVQPDKTDQTQYEKHRSKTTANKPRPQQ